jgi:hypothetical protein
MLQALVWQSGGVSFRWKGHGIVRRGFLGKIRPTTIPCHEDSGFGLGVCFVIGVRIAARPRKKLDDVAHNLKH